MDAERFKGWVERYRGAWESNDRAEIEALFGPDAEYFDSPGDEPWRGPERIRTEWLDRKDPPGETTFEYEVIATDGDLGFVRGVTYYRSEDNVYDNLWEITLDADDRCRSFTEWWMVRPKTGYRRPGSKK
jgi:ketosteroid isomerase-like protein